MAHGSTARKDDFEDQVSEVQASEVQPQTIAARFAEYNNVYVTVANGFPIAVQGDMLPGFMLARRVQAAHNALTSGKQKDLSDADKQAWLQKQISSDDTDGEMSLLRTAIDRLIFELTPGDYATDKTDYWAHVSPAEVDGRTSKRVDDNGKPGAPVFDRLLNDPAQMKRAEDVERLMNAVLTERRPVRTRSKGGEPEVLAI